MADTVTTDVLYNSPRKYVVHFQNASDGTGESAVQKIDISTLTGPDGINAPSSLALLEVQWNVTGFTYVDLLWDATTDDQLIRMSGNGYVSYDGIGGFADPKSSGTTGDVMLTTAGATSSSAYSITCVFKKKP